MSRCPRCQTENPLGAAACQSCGLRLMSWGTMLMSPEQLAAARPKVTIRIVRADGGPEIVHAMRRDESIAGSGGDIALPDDPFVAPRQARFAFLGSALVVEDVGGGNGVFARLKTEARIGPGQELRCGRQRLRLEALAASPATAPRAWGSGDGGCRLRLVQLLEGGRRGDAFPLREGENLLGRENGDITFPTDGFVSGRHAVLTATGDQVVVRDAGSSNGTFVRLGAMTQLESGDQLLIGRQLLRVELAPGP